MDLVKQFTEDKVEQVLKALNAMYGITLDSSDINMGKLQEKALYPKNFSPPNYFWIEACASKHYIHLIGDELGDKAEKEINQNLHALMALHSLEFKTVTELNKNTHKTSFYVSKKDINKLDSLDNQHTSATWMIEQAGIKKAQIKEDDGSYYLTGEQMQKITGFMQGADKLVLAPSEKAVFPQDGLIAIDETGFANYKRVLPIATEIMDDRLKKDFPQIHDFMPQFAYQLQAMDNTAITEKWADEPKDVKARREKIQSQTQQKMAELASKKNFHTMTNLIPASDSNEFANKEVDSISREYAQIIEACMAIKGVEFIECDEKLRSQAGTVVTRKVLIIEESMLEPIVRYINRNHSSNDMFSNLGIGSNDFHIEARESNHNESLGSEHATKYLVISGEDNIERLRDLGAKIVKEPKLVSAAELFEDNARKSIPRDHLSNAMDNPPDNLVSLNEIRAQKLGVAQGNTR